MLNVISNAKIGSQIWLKIMFIHYCIEGLNPQKCSKLELRIFQGYDRNFFVHLWPNSNLNFCTKNCWKLNLFDQKKWNKSGKQSSNWLRKWTNSNSWPNHCLHCRYIAQKKSWLWKCEKEKISLRKAFDHIKFWQSL